MAAALGAVLAAARFHEQSALSPPLLLSLPPRAAAAARRSQWSSAPRAGRMRRPRTAGAGRGPRARARRPVCAPPVGRSGRGARRRCRLLPPGEGTRRFERRSTAMRAPREPTCQKTKKARKTDCSMYMQACKRRAPGGRGSCAQLCAAAAHCCCCCCGAIAPRMRNARALRRDTSPCLAPGDEEQLGSLLLSSYRRPLTGSCGAGVFLLCGASRGPRGATVLARP